MRAKVLTGAVVGMDGALVEVEGDIAQSGLPTFLIVGLPDTAVQEARERVRAASRNSGLAFPKRWRHRYCGYHLERRRRPDAGGSRDRSGAGEGMRWIW